MANERSFYVTLDECIKKALVLCGETSVAYYQRFVQWASMCVNELGWDVSANLKRTYLGIDTATQTAKLPDDFVQWTRVGIRNSNNEFMPLQYNDSLITTFTTPECHCGDCGCADELCQQLGSGSFTTTVEDGKTISICVQGNGDIIKKTCEPVVTNIRRTCDYQITLSRPELLSDTYTNFSLWKNNVEYPVGDITTTATMTAVMTANGFVVDSSNVSTVTYGIDQTTDVWNYAAYMVGASKSSTDFVQSACVQPSPITETFCNTETICNVPIKPCGCIDVSQIDDLALNVLQSVANINISLISRWRYLKDFSQTFKTPPNYWGEFNLDVYNNIIVFNFDFQYSGVFLEYYSANEVDSKDYLVPVFAERPIIFYCKWMLSESKSNVPQVEKQRNMKMYYNQKRRYRERANPARVDTIMNSVRVTPRP